MSLHISSRTCPRTGRTRLLLQQTVSLVLPAPPLMAPGAVSLEALLGTRLHTACPAASRSAVYLGSSGLQAPGGSTATASVSAGAARLHVVDMLQRAKVAVAGSSPPLPLPPLQLLGAPGVALTRAAPFQLQRFVTGSGTLRGSLVLLLRRTAGPAGSSGSSTGGSSSSGGSTSGSSSNGSSSNGGSGPGQLVCIFQVVPWQVRLWLHTLRLSWDDVGQVRLGWDDVGQVRLSWDAVGQVRLSWDAVGQVWLSWDDVGQVRLSWDDVGQVRLELG